MEDRKLETFAADDLRWGQLQDWIQLIRLPNVFTLLSNCVAAAVIAVGSIGRFSAVVPLFIAAVLAYWVGLILNDVNDIEEDRQHRPDRPLSSGRVSPVVAGHVATFMSISGLTIVAVTLLYHKADRQWMIAALSCNVMLSVAIRLYNSSLKMTVVGPLLMGACRSLNILAIGFGMLGVYWEKEFSSVVQFPNSLVAYAIAMGVYICGLTTYARKEEQASNQATLILGTILQLAGLVVIAILPMWTTSFQFNWGLPPNSSYPVLIGLIGATILNRAMGGVLHPVPRKVQLAVKHAILSLIMIDAAVVLLFAGTWYGVGVVLLLIPAVIGAMRVRTT
jgi:4-hydroxybenzoate polyprenyltransferase